jgi:hypothetical protein
LLNCSSRMFQQACLLASTRCLTACSWQAKGSLASHTTSSRERAAHGLSRKRFPLCSCRRCRPADTDIIFYILIGLQARADPRRPLNFSATPDCQALAMNNSFGKASQGLARKQNVSSTGSAVDPARVHNKFEYTKSGSKQKHRERECTRESGSNL